MENTMTKTTSPILSNTPGSASAFAMSMRGCTVGAQWIPATGVTSVVTTPESVICDRKDLAAKGHVALVAYVPGIPAWSPPLC